MKHLPISGCIEGVCPFFKREKHYDYNDELTCTHPSIKVGYQENHMREWENKRMDIDGEIITLPQNCNKEGLYPKWCPLEEMK